MKTKYIVTFFIIFVVIFSFAFFLNKKEIEKERLILDVKEKYADRKDMPIFDGSFEEYRTAKVSLADSRKVILFFNAPWCPSCSLFLEEIKSVKIPNNVMILSVDYDTNPELRKKYKIALQHTFVEVDREGNELYKWSGGGIERLKKELRITN